LLRARDLRPRERRSERPSERDESGEAGKRDKRWKSSDLRAKKHRGAF
jgi:hypothetical protein